MTRVMFVVPDLQIGGAERHVATLLPRLDPDRFTPTVVCLGAEGVLFPTLAGAGIEAVALHRSKRQALPALLDLVAVMRRVRPDVVILRGYNAETLGRIAARMAGVRRTIVWVHHIGDLTPRGNVRTVVDRMLDHWTDAYFGVAEAQRSYLTAGLGFPDGKTHIIRNGVDPDLFDVDTDRRPLREFRWAPDGPVVGILAALRPEKDHGTFLRAARIVVDILPEAKFLVVGDGETRPQIERLRLELGLERHVQLTGVRSDVARLLRAVDVFSLSSATVECFPMALLEAMACGRPAVCTAVGGVPEMIDDGVTGYLVPPRDPERLADRLVRVLSDPEAARRMGIAGRRRVEEEFTLTRSVAGAQNAIDRVVGARPLRLEGASR